MPAPVPGTVRVLGIDPGTRLMGYGLLDAAPRGTAAAVAYGAVRLPGHLPAGLEKIFHAVEALIAEHRPQAFAIEAVFHGRNFQSVRKVGEARGVALLAAQLADLRIFEYAPAVVKKSVTGNGGADKAQVQRMLARVLRLDGPPEPVDASDALAVAWTCAAALDRGRRLGAEAAPALRVRARSGKGRPARPAKPLAFPRRRGRRSAALLALLRSGKARWVDRERAIGAHDGKGQRRKT